MLRYAPYCLYDNTAVCGLLKAIKIEHLLELAFLVP